MTDKPDNPPAFPIPLINEPGAYPAEPGMSLRDWFAGHALFLRYGPRGTTASCEEMASFAYQMADAMLAERAKEPKP